MNDIYDVAVVGAGPAGSVFAKELNRFCPELKVALIDGQTEERSKPCGGLLAPDAQKVLAEFDLTLPNSLLADPQIFTVETIDLVSRKKRYYQRHYLNMDRYKFDRWLLSLVPSEVDIIRSRVKELSREDGAFTLLLSDREIRAKNVVGADGGGSLVRRSFFKKVRKQYVSIQEWYHDNGGSLPYYSCIFDPETSDSCSWMIRKDGYVIFGGAFEMEGCKKAFELQKSRVERYLASSFGQPLMREACLVSSPRRLSDFECGENGAFLIGEAAGFISASSFEGISSAMISGRLLAESFSESDILRAYRKKTLSLRMKLRLKSVKRRVLCSPLLRNLIMISGIKSIKTEKREELKDKIII